MDDQTNQSTDRGSYSGTERQPASETTGHAGTGAQQAREPETGPGRMCLIKNEDGTKLKLGVWKNIPAGYTEVTGDLDVRGALADFGAHELREMIVNGLSGVFGE